MRLSAKNSAGQMPTAAKLVAALVLAIIAWALHGVIVFRHPGFADGGASAVHFAIAGLFAGWYVIGAPAQSGYRRAWTAGVQGVFVMLALIVIYATTKRVIDAFGFNRIKSLQDVADEYVRRVAELGGYLVDGPLLLLAVACGLLAGTFAAFAGRLWK